MSAHSAVIPPASPREKLKDRGFRGLLMFCTVAGVGMLGLLLYDVAAGQIPSMSADPGEPHATMTAFIAGTAKGDVPTGSIGYETIFAVGTTLFFMTLLMNAIAIRFVRRYRQVYE